MISRGFFMTFLLKKILLLWFSQHLIGIPNRVVEFPRQTWRTNIKSNTAESTAYGRGASTACFKNEAHVGNGAPLLWIIPRRVSCIIFTCKQISSNGERCIFGSWNSAKASNHDFENKRYTSPGRTRPARSFLCVAQALEIHVWCNVETAVYASYPFSLSFPESMTYTTSSIVTAVSAMFVDSTTFFETLCVGLAETPSSGVAWFGH